MPLYEYTCRKCETRFEKLVKSMTSDEKPPCPKCGSAKTERAMSVFAAVGKDSSSKDSVAPPGMCGRCGGPGPCGMD